MANIIQNNFTNGEISPDLYNRFDLSKYFNSCQLLQGFIPIPQGGATLMPGTYYCGAVKDSTKNTRLIPFIFSETQAYQLEFGDLYIRFWFKNKAQVISTDGSVTAWVTATAYYEGQFVTQTAVTYRCLIAHTSGTFATDLAAGKWVASNIAEISTPYGEEDLAKLKVVGSLDVMYIFHPDYAPRKLTRYDHTHWALTTPVWNRGPFKEENKTTVTITPTVTGIAAWVTTTVYAVGNHVTNGGNTYRCLIAHTSGTFATDLAALKWTVTDVMVAGDAVTLTASSALFSADHVGSYWQIAHWRDIPFVKETITVDNTYSASLEIYGNWEFETHNSWKADCVLQRSQNGGTIWEDYRRWSSHADYNVIVTGNELFEGVKYRFGLENKTDTSYLKGCLKNLEPVKKGVVQITGYTSATVVTGVVVKTIHNVSATKKWSEPLWSDVDSWPTCGCFHEERLFMGRGNSLASSKSSDFENMEITDGDDSGMVFYLANNTLENIHWLKSAGEVMIIGTEGGVWKVEPFDTNKPLSPTNISTRKQATEGVDETVDSILVGALVVYVHRQPKILEAIGYDFNNNKWVPSEITVLFKHLTEDYPIIDLCFQETPHPILWCLREDGLLFGITYNSEHKIIGAHRHIINGRNAESISVIPGDNNEDSLWMIVDRGSSNCVEATMPFSFGDQKDAFFVHSGLSFDGGDVVDITDISKAAEAVVTCFTDDLTDGDQIKIKEVCGMAEVNEKVFTVSDKGAATIKIKDETGTFYINSTDFNAYVSGGVLEIVEKNFSGLSHLAGDKVSVIADGAYHPEVTVSDAGAIELKYFANKVHAGLFYPAIIKPVKVEMPMSTSMGPVSLHGAKRKIHEIIVTLKNSLGGRYGEDENSSWGNASFIKNGDFEADYAGTEWADINTPDTSERSTADKYEGNYSYHIIDSTPSYGGREYHVYNWERGKCYRLTFFYKRISGAVSVWVLDNNGDRLIDATLASTTWARYSCNFRCMAENGALGKIRWFNASNTEVAEFYFDLIELYEINNLNSEPIVPAKQNFLIPYLNSGDVLGDPPPLFTGEKRLSFPGGFETGGDVVIMQDKPLPMTITSILYKIDSYGI